MSENDKIVDISDLLNTDLTKSTKPQIIKAYTKLCEMATGLSELVNNLEQRLNNKDAEIEHLKQMLNAVVPKLEKIEITPEEEIALKQLELLKGKTGTRQMSLEEARIFDILVKNKRLAQGESTTINADYKKLEGADNTKLLSIAKKKTSK